MTSGSVIPALNVPERKRVRALFPSYATLDASFLPNAPSKSNTRKRWARGIQVVQLLLFGVAASSCLARTRLVRLPRGGFRNCSVSMWAATSLPLGNPRLKTQWALFSRRWYAGTSLQTRTKKEEYLLTATQNTSQRF